MKRLILGVASAFGVAFTPAALAVRGVNRVARSHRHLVLLMVLMLTWTIPADAGDPYLQWWTIHAPHARVHYYRGLEPIADRVAALIEDLHDGMTRDLGWSPRDRIEVVITDDTDSANGSATAFPYPTVRLFVTAPDDMSPLGDYDEWPLEIVSHEFTHVYHMDNISGLPAVINAVLGRSFVPNQAQPRWILEGFAVINESRNSTGGRIKSSMFDMFLRADVLDNRLVTLDQMTNSPMRWPQGNVWYLYGSRFLKWVTDVYGYDVLAAIAADSGAQLSPFGVNRSVRRATGRTYEELYDAWTKDLRERYAQQLRPVEQRGLREGVRLTHHGMQVARPTFDPRTSSSSHAELLYYRSDASHRSGLYRLSLKKPASPTNDKPSWQVLSDEIVVRTNGETAGALAPDGSIFFNSSVPWKRTYNYNDLFRLAPHSSAPSGKGSNVRQLTFGSRARDPDVSPDGLRIAYVVNHRGTSYLKIASLTSDGAVENPRTLVPSGRFEQAFTPRFSPDGTKIAYSAWTTGGYRDIRIVDAETGKFWSLMHDRAIDMQPVFSPDGKHVLFSSDRTGIANIYAYELSTRKLHQVTNVRTGAYQPELSSDGTLAYVGYTSAGFDLYAMRFDEKHFLPALPPRSRVDPPARKAARQFPKSPYNPLPTLRPRSLSLAYGPGTYGQALTISTLGSDAVGHHSIALSANIETEKLVPYATASYSYHRLPFEYYSTLFRATSPRRGYSISGRDPTWLETTHGWTNGLTYYSPREFDSQQVGLAYAVAYVDGDLPVGSALDPYAGVGRDPLRGPMGVVHLGWAYSSTEGYSESVGPARGITLGASADLGNEYTASEYSVYAFGYQATAYVPNPFLDNHTLAVHMGGGAATGDYPRRGLYFVGGFVDTAVVDMIRNTVFQGGYVLRGYKPFSFIGSQYHLANFEYRFPIATVDRGVSTLPVFFRRLNGSAFLDYGGSFNRLDVMNWRDQFHTGIGAELWFEFELGYYALFNLRLGYAKGFGEFGEPGGQKYLVVAAPF